MIIGKTHWDLVRSCTIHRGSHLEIGSSPGNPTLEQCDHELLTISVEIPGSPPNTSEPPDERPERLQFHTDKLKEKPTLEKFQHALELSSTHALGRMEDTLTQFTAATIDRETLINTLHGIFTQNLQKVATSTLGKLKNHPPHHTTTTEPTVQLGPSSSEVTKTGNLGNTEANQDSITSGPPHIYHRPNVSTT